MFSLKFFEILIIPNLFYFSIEIRVFFFWQNFIDRKNQMVKERDWELTFLNKSCLVGIVYMAVLAAVLITQGWCLASVLP